MAGPGVAVGLKCSQLLSRTTQNAIRNINLRALSTDGDSNATLKRLDNFLYHSPESIQHGLLGNYNLACGKVSGQINSIQKLVPPKTLLANKDCEPEEDVCERINRECCRITMPGCCAAKCPPKCQKVPVPHGPKIKPPVRSFAECCYEPNPVPPNECNCWRSKSICQRAKEAHALRAKLAKQRGIKVREYP